MCSFTIFTCYFFVVFFSFFTGDIVNVEKIKLLSLILLSINLLLNVAVMICAIALKIYAVGVCMSLPYLTASIAAFISIRKSNIVALHIFLAVEIMNLIPLTLVKAATVDLWIVLTFFQIKTLMIAYFVMIYQTMQVKIKQSVMPPAQGFYQLEENDEIP